MWLSTENKIRKIFFPLYGKLIFPTIGPSGNAAPRTAAGHQKFMKYHIISQSSRQRPVCCEKDIPGPVPLSVGRVRGDTHPGGNSRKEKGSKKKGRKQIFT